MNGVPMNGPLMNGLPVDWLSPMQRLYQFRNCTTEVDYRTGSVSTRFPDGTSVPAVPHATEEYQATAARLGYGSDVAMLCREHELLHTIVMETLGFPHSPTLWAVAHGFEEGTASVAWQHHEEALICDFQWVLNSPKLHWLLPARIHGEGQPYERWVNWFELRRRAWYLLREPEERKEGWRARRRSSPRRSL